MVGGRKQHRHNAVCLLLAAAAAVLQVAAAWSNTDTAGAATALVQLPGLGRQLQQAGGDEWGSVGGSIMSSAVDFVSITVQRTMPPAPTPASAIPASSSGSSSSSSRGSVRPQARGLAALMQRLMGRVNTLSMLLPDSRGLPEFVATVRDVTADDRPPHGAEYPPDAPLKPKREGLRSFAAQRAAQQAAALRHLPGGGLALDTSALTKLSAAAAAAAAGDDGEAAAALARLLRLNTIGAAGVANGTLEGVPVDPEQKGLLPGLTHVELPVAARGGAGAEDADALVEVTTEPLGVYRPPPVTAVTARAEELPLSSHQCYGAMYEHRICKYHDLLLWNGTFYYIVDELNADLEVPTVPLAWVVLDAFNKEVLAVNVTTRDRLPFAKDGDVPVHYVRDALLWLLTYFDNYGHLLGEHGPTIHSMICTWLGRCSYSEEDLNNFNIILTNADPDVVNVYPESIKEMFDCLARDPPRTVHDKYFKGKAVIIGTSVAGIGPTCRGFPWCRPRYNRQAPVPHMMLTWKTRMMKCMGLPQDLVAKTERPYLLFINRHVEAGRAFLNLDDIVAQVKEKHPQFDVEVRHLEDMTMRQQALLYHNASMLVQMHGAALGNMIFLPRGAVVVDVVPQNNEDKHPWVIYMGQDFKPLYYAPVIIPPQKTHLMMDKVEKTKEYQLLSEAQKKALLERAQCPRQDERPEYDTYAACNFAWFLKRSNVELNDAHIDSAIMQAIAVLNDKDRIKFVN